MFPKLSKESQERRRCIDRTLDVVLPATRKTFLKMNSKSLSLL